MQSYAFLTFLAISSQLPFPHTTYPEATQIANHVKFNLLQCDAGEGWAHLWSESNCFSGEELGLASYEDPSQVAGSRLSKKAPSLLGFPRGAELQELCSQHLLLPTSTPFQNTRPIRTVSEKMKMHLQSTTQAACSYQSPKICNSKAAEPERQRFPGAESHFWHPLSPPLTPPTPPPPPYRGHLQSPTQASYHGGLFYYPYLQKETEFVRDEIPAVHD